jgi:hypothetical protein
VRSKRPCKGRFYPARVTDLRRGRAPACAMLPI